MDIDYDRIKHIIDNDCFIGSDLHLFHDKLFSEYEPVRKTHADTRLEFDEKVIQLIQHSSPFLYLGDFCIDTYNPEITNERVKEASLKIIDIPKILILGNHDTAPIELYQMYNWDVIPFGVDMINEKEDLKSQPYLFFEWDGAKVFASHYPAVLYPDDFSIRYKEYSRQLYEKSQELNADINIHGHTHSVKLNDKKLINACIDGGMFLKFYRISSIAGRWKEEIRKFF